MVGILAGGVMVSISCHNGMTIRGIQRETDILIDPASLRPVPILAPDHGTLQHKSLLFHPRLRTQGTCHIVQIPDFIPLVLGKSNRYGIPPSFPHPRLDLKCLLKLGR
jgi:hypothetical protein